MRMIFIILIFLISLPSQAIAWQISPSLHYENCNEPIFLDSGWKQLDTQTLTKQDSPYCLSHENTLPTNKTLTIEQGTVIKFAEPYNWASQGVKLYVNGILQINGTKQNPVIFTSIYDDSYLGDTNNDENNTKPGLGDWDIFDISNSQTSDISYAVFKYGGKNTGKMIKVNNGKNISIKNSIITKSWGDGIAVVNNFKNFEYNLIFDNQGSGLKNWGLEQTIDARFNWWGSSQGPLIYGINEPDDSQAERIENFFSNSIVLFEPWLSSPDEIIPIWRRNIEAGDILYDPYSWGVGHAGIYIGNNKTIEAQGTFDGIKLAGKVNENNITKWDYPNRKNVYLLRIKKPDNKTDLEWQEIKNNAIEFAKSQQDPIEKPYDWAWLKKSYDINSPSWYCSELVWAAYYNQGINLEHYGDADGKISPVSPAEIYLDDDTYIVSGHQEYQGGWKDYVFLMVLSPIEITVTDPEGNTMTKNLINIPGAHYLQDVIDASGHTYDQIILPNINVQYQISVSKKAGVGADETYSLHIKNGDNSLQKILAQDKTVPADGQADEYSFNPSSSNITGAGSFYDIENSNSNTWAANTLDIDITALNDFTTISPSQNSQKEFLIQNNGGLNVQYNIILNNFSGNANFCNLLNLQTNDYNGPLTNFIILTRTLNSGKNNNFNFTITLNSNEAQWKNQTCNFDFNLTAWQTNFQNSSLGFSDTEIINNNITSGEWVEPEESPEE